MSHSQSMMLEMQIAELRRDKDRLQAELVDQMESTATSQIHRDSLLLDMNALQSELVRMTQQCRSLGEEVVTLRARAHADNDEVALLREENRLGKDFVGGRAGEYIDLELEESKGRLEFLGRSIMIRFACLKSGFALNSSSPLFLPAATNPWSTQRALCTMPSWTLRRKKRRTLLKLKRLGPKRLSRPRRRLKQLWRSRPANRQQQQPTSERRSSREATTPGCQTSSFRHQRPTASMHSSPGLWF